MGKKHKFERFLELSDEDSYSEYLKLTQSEKAEYELFMVEHVERHKKLTMKAKEKIKELEEEHKKLEVEYKKLSTRH